MHKTLATVSAIALAGLTSLWAIAPAAAAPNLQMRQQFVGNWCDRHPNDPSCQDFRVHHNRWGNAQYQMWYRSHQHDSGFDPLAAGIFGFAAGALIAGAAANSDDDEVIYDDQAMNDDDHIAACEDAYRSYDLRTDTYLGYDGYRHQCQL